MLRQFAVIFHCNFLSPALLFVLGFSLPPFYSGETLALSPVLRACLGPLFFCFVRLAASGAVHNAECRPSHTSCPLFLDSAVCTFIRPFHLKYFYRPLRLFQSIRANAYLIFTHLPRIFLRRQSSPSSVNVFVVLLRLVGTSR